MPIAPQLEAVEESKTEDILILGISGSGKTTLFKSIMLTMDGFPEDFRTLHKDLVFQNIIMPMVEILKAMDLMAAYAQDYGAFRKRQAFLPLALSFLETKEDASLEADCLPPQIAHLIKELLLEHRVQEAFLEREKYCPPDNID
jgi:predicted NACHT family NTPase